MSLRPRLYTSKVWLHRELVIKGKTIEQIADEQGVTRMTIFNNAVKFGLVRGTKATR
jgi:hypothetical protein